MSVKAQCLVVIADSVDGVADDLLGVDLGGGIDLTGENDSVVLDDGLGSSSCGRIFRQIRIEDGIGDLVGYLVGMSFGDGLGCENILAHKSFLLIKNILFLGLKWA